MSTHSITSSACNAAARISRAANMIAPQFRDDACITYFLNNMSDNKRLAFLEEYFHVLIKAAMLNGGTIYETADWQSAVVIVPPGKDVANPVHFLPAGGFNVLAKLGPNGVIKMLYEFPRHIGHYKSLALEKSDFYYIFIVATKPEGRGQGLASSILKEVLATAQKERKSAWLEATSEGSKSVYAKLGFEELGTVVLGKGKVNADGRAMRNGPGVRIWPMIWRPETSDRR